MDQDTNDIANGLSSCVTKDGQSGALTANLQMGSHKITGLANGSASSDAVTYGQVFQAGSGYTNISISGATLTGIITGTGASSFLVPTMAPGDNTQAAASTAFVAATAFSSALPATGGVANWSVVGRQAGVTGWIGNGGIFHPATRSTNTILGLADHASAIDFYSANNAADFTQTLTAAATLGNGWWCILRNLGLGSGANVAVNGTFTTNTDWTLGSGVTISGGVLNLAAAGNAAAATAIVPPIVSGRVYTVTYTIAGYSSGSVYVGVGTTNTSTRMANGTYTETVTSAGTSLIVYSTTNTTCTVDNLIVTDDLGAVITIDPNASETIGGALTAQMHAGEKWLVYCDGTNFQVERMAGRNAQIYTSGTGNFTPPGGVYAVEVELWAPAGTNKYLRKFSYAVTPGVNVAYDASGSDVVFGWLSTAGSYSDTPVMLTPTNKAIIVRWI
jgi:hypothetical protein